MASKFTANSIVFLLLTIFTVRVAGVFRRPLEDIVPVCTPEDILSLQALVRSIHVKPSLRRYLAEISAASRIHHDVRVGVSVRGTQKLMHAAQALALIGHRDYVTPDDVQAIAPACLAHRLILRPEARLGRWTSTPSSTRCCGRLKCRCSDYFSIIPLYREVGNLLNQNVCWACGYLAEEDNCGRWKLISIGGCNENAFTDYPTVYICICPGCCSNSRSRGLLSCESPHN